jgi:thiol-disulfide isomerase/thioredoxin
MKAFRRILLASAVALVGAAGLANASSVQDIVFHFYGAEDCGPCMAFKRSGLPIVKASAARSGFSVAANIIPKTRDVATIGAYGDADATLRAAAPMLEFVYPPIFFVSRDGEVVSVHGVDWEAALQSAERQTENQVNQGG